MFHEIHQQITDCVGGVRRHRGGPKSRGVAAAELAVCLPVVVLIVIATIEACSAMFLKQSLTVAAYEGVRTALAERHVAGSVQAACNQILNDRNVKGATVTISPPNIASLQAGRLHRRDGFRARATPTPSCRRRFIEAERCRRRPR